MIDGNYLNNIFIFQQNTIKDKIIEDISYLVSNEKKLVECMCHDVQSWAKKYPIVSLSQEKHMFDFKEELDHILEQLSSGVSNPVEMRKELALLVKDKDNIASYALVKTSLDEMLNELEEETISYQKTSKERLKYLKSELDTVTFQSMRVKNNMTHMTAIEDDIRKRVKLKEGKKNNGIIMRWLLNKHHYHDVIYNKEILNKTIDIHQRYIDAIKNTIFSEEKILQKTLNMKENINTKMSENNKNDESEKNNFHLINKKIDILQKKLKDGYKFYNEVFIEEKSEFQQIKKSMIEFYNNVRADVIAYLIINKDTENPIQENDGYTLNIVSIMSITRKIHNSITRIKMIDQVINKMNINKWNSKDSMFDIDIKSSFCNDLFFKNKTYEETWNDIVSTYVLPKNDMFYLQKSA